MNKSEQREVNKLGIYLELGLVDAVARGMSGLIRACMTSRSRKALMEQAQAWGIVNHPEFII